MSGGGNVPLSNDVDYVTLQVLKVVALRFRVKGSGHIFHVTRPKDLDGNQSFLAYNYLILVDHSSTVSTYSDFLAFLRTSFGKFVDRCEWNPGTQPNFDSFFDDFEPVFEHFFFMVASDLLVQDASNAAKAAAQAAARAETAVGPVAVLQAAARATDAYAASAAAAMEVYMAYTASAAAATETVVLRQNVKVSEAYAEAAQTAIKAAEGWAGVATDTVTWLEQRR